MRETIKPTYDVPIDEAMEDLNRFELIELKKLMKAKSIEDVPADEVAHALVYLLEKRTNSHITFDEVSRRSLREVLGYFPQDDPSIAVVDENSEVGKE